MKTTAKKVKANKNKEIKENDVYYMRWTDIYINKNAFQAVFNKKEQTNWYTDVIIHEVPRDNFKPYKTKEGVPQRKVSLISILEAERK